MDYFKITTDETLRETVQHGSERYPFAYYPEDIWQFDFHRIDWHWHHTQGIATANVSLFLPYHFSFFTNVLTEAIKVLFTGREGFP